jgi:hypothetical protein
VTHQGSAGRARRDILRGFLPHNASKTAARHLHDWLSRFGLLVCQFCDKSGRFVSLSQDSP